MPQTSGALPSFETPRLHLRPRTMGDFDACMTLDSDPEVIKYIDVPWTDERSHREFVKKRLSTVYPDGMGYWSVFAKDNPDAFLGWVILMPLDTLGPEIEIGWRLARAAWGRGYAPEAAALLLDHGFRTLALDRIIAIIQPENTRSASVAEKIGMRHVGTEDHNGIPVLNYEQTRSEFERMRLPGSR